MKLQLAIASIIVAGVVGEALYFSGSSAGYREASEKYLKDLKTDREDRCCRGESQPCVFGPGIVGVKNCIFTTWDKCEPDPRYRITDGAK